MQRAKLKDFVTVIYEGVLETGEIFESSADTGPLSFITGNKEVLPAFDQGVIGMTIGETKTIRVEPEDAFGPRNETLIHTFPPETFGDNKEIKPGMIVGMTMEQEGQPRQVPALVVEVKNNGVVVDFNHPLAGEVLTYQITLQSIDESPGASSNDS
ncbi:MAG: peptidylprolyl isomerase [Proteobacteria bacterium]|nr:peptidylprolyl isomerase [Pseudomonadota bacterium]MBU1709663.1 peptidylprolyl isomerase [Pseudomonadota bacterium]